MKSLVCVVLSLCVCSAIAATLRSSKQSPSTGFAAPVLTPPKAANALSKRLDNSFVNPVTLVGESSPRSGYGVYDGPRMSLPPGEKPVVIGVAADSGCGKSTFMRRVTQIFGGKNVGLLPIGRETNTLVSDIATIICLDDYHSLDRKGRAETGLSALDPKANNFDLMYEQVKAIKEGTTVEKPIYNHITGELDPAETIEPSPIFIVEGLHPIYDSRVKDLVDFSVYLDITDDVKFAWKIQRDMEERGHSLESIQKSIESRKPDFAAYVEPQKKEADIVIQVLPSSLVDDPKGKYLKVRLIQRLGVENFTPVELFESGADVDGFAPSKTSVPQSTIGLKIKQYSEDWFGHPARVLEMDGEYDDVSSLAAIEKFLVNAGEKSSAEVVSAMEKVKDAPGSLNGTGFLQTLCALKIREVYEKIQGETVEELLKKVEAVPAAA